MSRKLWCKPPFLRLTAGRFWRLLNRGRPMRARRRMRAWWALRFHAGECFRQSARMLCRVWRAPGVLLRLWDTPWPAVKWHLWYFASPGWVVYGTLWLRGWPTDWAPRPLWRAPPV